MRPFVLAFLLAAACTPMPVPDPLPFLGDGYRAAGDQCRLVGESDATVAFLDDAADLVGCPEDLENLGLFAVETGGIEVARIAGFVLYSVPTR